jgi:hypothetical protein
MISFREILTHIHSGKVFSCKVVTFDKQKQTGGELREYRAVLLRRDPMPNLRPSTAQELEAYNKKIQREPNHRLHYTRNIRIVTEDGFKTQVIKKIHIPLIVEFNGQKVTP